MNPLGRNQTVPYPLKSGTLSVYTAQAVHKMQRWCGPCQMLVTNCGLTNTSIVDALSRSTQEFGMAHVVCC